MHSSIDFINFQGLATAFVADACSRLSIAPRIGSAVLRPLVPPATLLVGVVRPVWHGGSADILLEAMQACQPGEVMVIDNAARQDEACVGDLIALEAQKAGLAGMVIWGLHRDSVELQRIGLPIFSLGAYPGAPREARPRPSDALTQAVLGDYAVSGDDIVVADADGIVFFPTSAAAEIAACAHRIAAVEAGQAQLMRAGTSLRQQIGFDEYLAERARDPGYHLREHLRRRDGALEG